MRDAGTEPSTELRKKLDKRFCRRSRVHRAGAEAFGIQRDKGESQGLEDAGELSKHRLRQGAPQLFLGNLNPGYVAVMANANLPETQGAQRVFTLLHGGKCLGGYGPAILDAGREASGGWLVPDTETGLPSQVADVGLGQPGIEQWSGNPMLPGSGLSGPEVALIVRIDAVGNALEPALHSERLHYLKQLVFAVETAP